MSRPHQMEEKRCTEKLGNVYRNHMFVAFCITALNKVPSAPKQSECESIC